MTRIGVLGSNGRTGQAVIRLLRSEYAKKASFVGGVDRTDPMEELFTADAVIDFAAPEACLNLLRLSIKRTGKAPVLVIGSTQWKISEKRELEETTKSALVLMAPCLSLSFHIFQDAIKRVSPMLRKAGFDSVVVETERKDHPSGSLDATTIALQSILSPEASGNVLVQSVRATAAPSAKEVRCYRSGETLFIAHTIDDVEVPAKLAIEAALWLHQQKINAKHSQGILSQEAFFSAQLS